MMDGLGTPSPRADDGPVWMSIGDLMSGLLLLFALMLVVVLLRLKEQLEALEQSRILVIQSLKEQLEAEGIDVEVDKERGDISIAGDITFLQGSAELSPEGREFLGRFIPVYASILFGDRVIDEEVVRIVVEGHTSREGSYDENMTLSLMRANTVVRYASSMPAFPYQSSLLTEFMASGRGEIEADQTVDDPDDRRVAFRFDFQSEDLDELAQRFKFSEEMR